MTTYNHTTPPMRHEGSLTSACMPRRGRVRTLASVVFNPGPGSRETTRRDARRGAAAAKNNALMFAYSAEFTPSNAERYASRVLTDPSFAVPNVVLPAASSVRIMSDATAPLAN